MIIIEFSPITIVGVVGLVAAVVLFNIMISSISLLLFSFPPWRMRVCGLCICNSKIWKNGLSILLLLLFAKRSGSVVVAAALIIIVRKDDQHRHHQIPLRHNLSAGSFHSVCFSFHGCNRLQLCWVLRNTYYYFSSFCRLHIASSVVVLNEFEVYTWR